MTDIRIGAKRVEALQLLLPVGIFLLALIARTLPGARTIDDSYITYRYVRNILAGVGFVYNPGERVMGTTTPLYTGLMTLGGLFAGGTQAPFPQISMLVNALADGITCLLLIYLGRRLGFRFVGLGAALAWAVAPFSVTFAIGGLETSVYVLLLVGTVAAHLARRPLLTALLAGLAFLTRPDALILIALLALDRLWSWWSGYRRGELDVRQMIGEWLAFGVPVAAWLGFATLYFGSPIPHSIAAKTLAYQLAPEAGFVRLLQHYATPFLEQHTFGIRWIAVGMALYPFLFIVGSRRALKTQPRAWLLAVYPWLYFAAFALANPLIFRWYMTPPLPAYYLFILGGVETLLSSLFAGLKARRWLTNEWLPGLTALVLIVLAPALLSLRGWRLHPDHGLDLPAPEMAWYKLELLYQQAAAQIAPEAVGRTGNLPSLAAGDVGVLGYYTGMHIVDTVGLNSPQSTRFYPFDPDCYAINYAIPPGLILEAQPDVIVILEVYGRKCLLPDPTFQTQYHLRETIPTDIYGSAGMLILDRVQP